MIYKLNPTRDNVVEDVYFNQKEFREKLFKDRTEHHLQTYSDGDEQFWSKFAKEELKKPFDQMTLIGECQINNYVYKSDGIE